MGLYPIASVDVLEFKVHGICSSLTQNFGKQSKGHSEDKRIITSKNPLDTAYDFYKIATKGGISSKLENGKGIRTDMSDGTCFTLREISKSDGSPAINISARKGTSNSGVKTQKIHFTLGDN